jgi:hypothetical protein
MKPTRSPSLIEKLMSLTAWTSCFSRDNSEERTPVYPDRFEMDKKNDLYTCFAEMTSTLLPLIKGEHMNYALKLFFYS